MTKTEATREAKRMERDGWADVQIVVSDGLSRPVYGVSAIDPATGVRSPWYWTTEALREAEADRQPIDWDAIAKMEALDHDR